ncbi:hypothetical protein ES703_78731 [subsurface metagenome]
MEMVKPPRPRNRMRQAKAGNFTRHRFPKARAMKSNTRATRRMMDLVPIH